MTLRRRELLELIALLAAMPACKGGDAPKQQGSAAPPKPEPPRALDAAAYRTLDAATARLLPADGDFPGAREAGVIEFIDRQLAIQPIARLAPAIVAFARALDDAARARKARDFGALSIGDQDAVLALASTGELGTKLPEKELFKVLHGLVLEGFLSDPHHGGNKDQIAWRAIGFPEPSLRTRGGKPHH